MYENICQLAIKTNSQTLLASLRFRDLCSLLLVCKEFCDIVLKYIKSEFWFRFGATVEDLNLDFQKYEITYSGTIKFFNNTLYLCTKKGLFKVKGDELEKICSTNCLKGIAFDEKGNCYMASETCVSKLTPDGTLTVLAGKANSSGLTEFLDGPGDKALLNPGGIVYHPKNKVLYVTDMSHNSLRTIDMNGNVRSVIKGYAYYVGGRQVEENPFVQKALQGPMGICLNDIDGTLYISDTNSNTIKKIYPNTFGAVTTLKPTYPDLFEQTDVAYFREHIFVADNDNYAIKLINDKEKIATLFENPTEQMYEFKPWSICYDEKNKIIYCLDPHQQRIRMLKPKK